MQISNFKKRIAVTVLSIVSVFSFVGCDQTEETELPDLGIDWGQVCENATKERLSAFGWYADDLQDEIEEFGTVTFCNYDPTVFGAFKKVEYQFTIEYGCGYEYENEQVIYYEFPVYSIMLVDNQSEEYFAGSYDEEFSLLKEEGIWFLDENKTEYITTCLTNCQSIIKG